MQVPSFPRTWCQSERELRLWDECAATEGSVAGFRQLLEQISGAAAAALAACGPPPQRGPLEAKAMVGAAAARARCYRRAMSDEARQRAVTHARAIGALPSDFDETTLPWHAPRASAATHDVSPAAPVVEERGTRHVLVEGLLALQPHRANEAERSRVIAGRLAWLDFRNGTRGLVPGPPSAVSDLGVVLHADGSPAVDPLKWMYGYGRSAREGTRYYLPGGGQPFVDAAVPASIGASRQRVLQRVARLFGRDVAAAGDSGLNSLDVILQIVALMELVVQCDVAERAARAAGADGVRDEPASHAAEPSGSYARRKPKPKRRRQP
jgi:hypothetical protein